MLKQFKKRCELLRGQDMLTEKSNINQITTYLTMLCTQLTLKNVIYEFDENRYYEDVFCKILNIAYDIDLKNLNSKEENFPGIDLGDEVQKIAYQVSSDASMTKIRSTITTFKDKELYKEYTKLRFMFLVLKKPNYRTVDLSLGIDGLFDFSLKNSEDVIDFATLLEKVKVIGVSKQLEILEYLGEQVSVTYLSSSKKIVTKTENRLLNEMLKLELSNKIEMLLCGKIKTIKKNIETILNHNLENINNENKDTINYLRAMLYFYEDDIVNFELCIEKINNELLKKDIFNIKAMYSYQIFSNNFCWLSENEHSYYTLNALFKNKNYKKIINEFNPTLKDSEYKKYIFGTSLFFLGDFQAAINIYNDIIGFNEECRLFTILAKVFILYQDNYMVTELEKNEISKKIDELKEIQLVKSRVYLENETLFFDAYFSLLLLFNDELFMDEYSKIPTEKQCSNSVRKHLGTYYLRKKDVIKSNQIFEELYTQNKNIKYKSILMVAYIENACYDEAIDIFCQDVEINDMSTIGAYLFALSCVNMEKYLQKFNQYYDKYSNNNEQLLEYFFYSIDSIVKSRNFKIQKEILDFIRENLELICKQKNTTIFHFYQIANISQDKEIVVKMMDSINIEECSTKEREVLFSLIWGIHDDAVAEDIILSFIKKSNNNKHLMDFYIQKLKREKGMELKILVALKESFKIFPTKEVAFDIIQYSNYKEILIGEELEIYLQYLELDNETDPIVLSGCAVCFNKMDEYQRASELSYKSMYYLFDEVNSWVFDNYLNIYFSNIAENQNAKNSVSNLVFFLYNDSDEEILVCLNSTEEFQSGKNSIGMLHVEKKSPLFIQLYRGEIGEKIEFSKKFFVIKKILSKNDWVMQYIMGSEHKSEVIKGVIKEGGDGTLISQSIDLLNEFKTDNNLEGYNELSKGIGLPIEVIFNDGYSTYFDIIKTLLFGENMTLYAGDGYIMKLNENKKIVVTLSTFMVLSALKKLYLLRYIIDSIIIPSSLKNFLIKQAMLFSDNQVNSPGRIFLTDDNRLGLAERDSTESNYWQEILLLIESVETIEIKDEERLISDYYEIFNRLGLSNIQIDCLITSELHNAIFISDDLFFRNIATSINIENNNHTFLYDYVSKDILHNELFDLAKTNYTSYPFYY